MLQSLTAMTISAFAQKLIDHCLVALRQLSSYALTQLGHFLEYFTYRDEFL